MKFIKKNEWYKSFTKKKGLRRTFGSWKIPEYIVNRFSLEDGDILKLNVQYGSKIIKNNFKLTSGCEIILKKKWADEIKKYANKNKKGFLNFTLCFDNYLLIFEQKISKSKALAHQHRLNKIKKISKVPKNIEIKQNIFIRNPHIIAEVLFRANGLCECCKKKAPFIRKSDNTPYLEVHHIVSLSNGGEDTLENTIGLCPNCHREKHFG